MFKKYFIHEFKNSCQMPLTVCGLILGVSLLVGIGAILDLNFLFDLGMTALLVSIYSCIIIAVISVHKTMTGRLFSKSGYLTLTLPIETHTILISKILVNIIYALFYIMSAFIGVVVILGGFGVLESFDGTLKALGDILSGLIERFDIVLIELLMTLLTFVFVLCMILFYYSFINSGIIKKQSKILYFIYAVAFVIIISYIMSIEIIPYELTYNYNDKQYFIEHIDSANYMNTTVLDFSSVLWIVLGIIGSYFGSYYLIKNKLDII